MARLFIAPKQGTRSAANCHGVVEARIDVKRNDKGATGRMVHFGRSENRKLREWHSFWQQLNGSGDDMNIIQVGRPAVSRYHQQGRWYMVNEGPNHEIHDWPSSELGLKLGGFMLLPSRPTKTKNRFGRSFLLD